MHRIAIFIGIIFSQCWSFSFAQKTAKDFLENGVKMMEIGQFDSSLLALQAGIHLNQKNELNQTSADLYWRLGNANKMLEKFPEAFKAYKKSEVLNTKIGSQLGLANVYVSMIEYHRKRLNFNEADEYIELTSKLQQKIKFPDLLEAQFYSRRAAMEMEHHGDIAKSMEFSNRVLKIATKLNDPHLKMTAWNELGFAYENKNDCETAFQKYQLAFNAIENSDDYNSKINVLSNLGRCYTKMQKYKQAISSFEQAVKLCEDHGVQTAKTDIYFNLVRLYQDLKDYENAYYALIKYTGAYQKDISEKNEKAIVEIEKKYDLEKQLNINKDALRRAEIAEIETKNSLHQTYLWIGFSIFLIGLIIIITLLVLKLKRGNKLLEASNRNLIHTNAQKDAIFKELHHRVKNNLTLLKSILFLHAKSSKNEDVINVLQDCQNRIQSMSIVHQNLYETDDTTRIDLKAFLHTLIRQLEDAMLPSHKKIHVSIEDSAVTLEISKAVFIGIIFNELVTNSIKYAHNENDALSIQIQLKQEGEKLHFQYADNGQGLDDELNTEKGGFGFRLIHIMMRQLRTKLVYSKIDNKPTFRFIINK